MSQAAAELFQPVDVEETSGDFAREEVRLANRNSGILLEALRHDVTPVGLHYLLIHFDVPYVPTDADWTLDISGLVDRPQRFTLDDLKKFPQTTMQRVTLECAGNGRSGVQPRYKSQPWHHEAVGTAEWTGIPLKLLLEKAGLNPGAQAVVFYGRDRGLDQGVEHDYGRSLTPSHALDEDVMLVWAMNGAPLLPQHGFPLRLIVPGWYGMASVKWLDRIEVIDRPFDGFQQVVTYVYRERANDTGTPITTIRVKSLMVPPGIPDWYSRRRLVDQGPVELFGRAWSGGGVPIRKVEVAVDGVWQDAVLEAGSGRYAWSGWRTRWHATPGNYELMCRATDANGEAQPIEPPFDQSGLGNNAAHRVQVTVR